MKILLACLIVLITMFLLAVAVGVGVKTGLQSFFDEQNKGGINEKK